MIIKRTVTDALIEIGVINPIDEATPQDAAYGLRTLNRIIDSYNTQNLIVTYLESIQLPSPTTWANSVTLGTGLDIDYPAPLNIESAFFRDGTTDYPLQMMTSNSWSDITYKSDVAIPKRLYIQKTDENNLKLYFDCIPSNNLTLYVMAKKPYTGVNGLGNNYLPTDDINWTFGFEKMLMLRLAVELCSSYEIQPSQMLVSKAQEAENNLKTFNYQPKTMRSTFRSSRNYRTRYNRGYYR